jgi:hypothetical protein
MNELPAAAAEPDWDQLVSDALARVRLPVVGQEYVGALSSASCPQKFNCDDGNLYLVKFRTNPHGDGRAIFTEQVVALLGQLIGAPVPQVKLISITPELLSPLNINLNGVPAAPGLHHGSRWVHDFSDRSAFLRHTDANRSLFGTLRLLYSWLYCGGDHQLIYRNSEPHDPLSIDHSSFLPDGTEWSPQTLRGLQDTVLLDPKFDPLELTEAEHDAGLDKLEAVTAETIAEVAATPPDDWGILHGNRVALARYAWRRRIKLLANFGRVTG